MFFWKPYLEGNALGKLGEAQIIVKNEDAELKVNENNPGFLH